MTTIGQSIRAARLRSSFTQEKLSKLSGISRFEISGYETGRCEPRAYNLIALADALNISLDELVGRRIDVSEIDNQQQA